MGWYYLERRGLEAAWADGVQRDKPGVPLVIHSDVWGATLHHSVLTLTTRRLTRGECVRRSSLKVRLQYWHSGVWLYVCVCMCGCVDGVVRMCVSAGTSICTGCLYRCVSRRGRVCREYTYVQNSTCVCVCVYLWYACLCVQNAYACLCVFTCASAFQYYVNIISLTILLQYFYTSGRTVSCIIVSLNLGIQC